MWGEKKHKSIAEAKFKSQAFIIGEVQRVPMKITLKSVLNVSLGVDGCRVWIPFSLLAQNNMTFSCFFFSSTTALLQLFATEAVFKKKENTPFESQPTTLRSRTQTHNGAQIKGEAKGKKK